MEPELSSIPDKGRLWYCLSGGGICRSSESVVWRETTKNEDVIECEPHETKTRQQVYANLELRLNPVQPEVNPFSLTEIHVKTKSIFTFQKGTWTKQILQGFLL